MHTNEEGDPGGDRAATEGKLRDRIQEQLKRHGRVDSTKIGIVIRKGQVLLWGSVATELERTTTGEIAAAIAGRLNVINHIHVFPT